jgi:hypothetical protein
MPVGPTRTAAARDEGMFDHQRKQALRGAAVGSDQY